MASAEEEEKERAVFDDDDDDDGDDSEEEEEEEEGDDDDDDTDADIPAAAEAAPPPPPTMEAEPPADFAATNPNPNPSGGVGVVAEEARRLFQRLWTEEEELVILRGFAEFTTRRGTAFASHQYDTGPFYEQMRRQLPLDFSKSQLVEKLRRLKKKYLTCVSRLRSAPNSFAFRSPHEQALFQISRNIWSPSSHRPPDPDSNSNNSDSDRDRDRKPPPPPPPSPPPPRSRQRQRRRRLRRATVAAAAAEDPIAAAVSVPITVTAENQNPTTPKQPPDLLPLLFKELVGAAIRGPLLGFGSGAEVVSVDNLGDGRWRMQQILELEVYLKRLELLREHIESTLRELKGSSGGA